MSIVKAERIHGMMSLAQLEWLASEAKKRHRIVEIGCYRGRTTTVLCENTPGTVTAVDTWLGSPGLMEHIEFMQERSGDKDWLFSEFLRNTQSLPNLRICRNSSLQAAKILDHERFDMIFIDALHDYESVKEDILAWWPLVDVHGVLCGHDYQYPDVKRAVDEMFPVDGPRDSDFWAVAKG